MMMICKQSFKSNVKGEPKGRMKQLPPSYPLEWTEHLQFLVVLFSRKGTDSSYLKPAIIKV